MEHLQLVRMEKPVMVRIRDFFGFNTSDEFRSDWTKLSWEDQEWFKFMFKEEMGI